MGESETERAVGYLVKRVQQSLLTWLTIRGSR